ncbi:MAG: hypothetical protein NUW06_04400 [Candidatus Acetothermia bacterium]|jgi:hypothetical protein|nr:hypothetical protein [Candidatus Acetothermia bacterium]MDH7505299.1 hypothetical protein [Candidatus Acetothermia bacterium]
MARKEMGYLVNRLNWALYLGLTALLGAVTILTLPPSRRIGELISSDWEPVPFFAGTLLVAFGIFALQVGQREQGWRGRFQGRFGRYLAHISSQLGLGLLLTAPFWLIFKAGAYARPAAIISSAAYLSAYGWAWAAFGLLLATLPSETAQFQLKYLGFLAYLGGTFFWPAGSPFFNLGLLLQGHGYPVESVAGPLLLVALGGASLLFARRRIKRWSGSKSLS